MIFFKAKRLGSPSFHDCSYYAGRCSTAIRVVEDGCSGTEPLQSSLPTGGVLHLLQTEAASEIREMCYLTNHARFAVPPYCNYIQPFSLKDNKVQRLNIFSCAKNMARIPAAEMSFNVLPLKGRMKPSSRLDNGQEEQVSNGLVVSGCCLYFGNINNTRALRSLSSWFVLRNSALQVMI